MKRAILATVERHALRSEAELVEQVAAGLVELVRISPPGALALSGGRIAKALFRAVVGESRRRALDWGGWHCFWADERCVPPSHSESNYRVAREHLLDPLGWTSRRVHRLRGEWDPLRAAEAGQAELNSVVGRGGRLDLIMLGMGEDGHVASLFPGGKELGTEASPDYIAVKGPKPPADRVTLTLLAIKKARRVWVVVGGNDKLEVLERAMVGDPSLPLGRVLAARESSQVFYQE